ncbi:VOC family protein [Nocardioides sp. KIGAM211]|uniref:VOC family protein n=1 Tax=Nocardioides luti TaxID=2761101 RepID=A0A7X0VAF3_9ACTN|nr:VOC family protein [Nocardioides luti]MBB6626053.1 VOC family protein [Nocardioides luti]
MSLEWEQIIIAAEDTQALGHWWADVLGWVVLDDSVYEFEIRESEDRLPGIMFEKVDRAKQGKNRLHLDFRPDDQEAEVAKFLAAGATRVDVGQGDVPWEVLADPEGNEFCILAPRRT